MRLRSLLIIPELAAWCIAGIGGLLILAAAPVTKWCLEHRTGRRYGNVAPGW